MENARLAIIEDNESLVQVVETLLEVHGHELTEKLSTMEDVRRKVRNLSKSQIDAVIVDGNLGRETTGEDGAEAVSLIRRHLGGICVIGYSASGHVKGADYDSRKDINEVLSIIEAL